MAILKLDIGIHNIGIEVSKCILINLVELSSCGKNSFWSKSTSWMIFHPRSVSPFSLGYPSWSFTKNVLKQFLIRI
jgi:hypothetical protein